MKQSFFIFSFKLLLFLTGFLGVLNCLSEYIPVKREEKLESSIKILEATRDSVDYDVFFFSNSYIFTSVDPLYLEHLTGLKGLLFCAPNQRTAYTLETIKNIIKIKKPKCIVLDLSRASTVLPTDDASWSFNQKALLSSGVSFSKIKTIFESMPTSEPVRILNSFSPLTASLANINQWNKFRMADESSNSNGYLGFYPLKKQVSELKGLSEAEFKEIYLKDHFNTQQQFFDDFTYKKFIEFLSDFSDQGISVVFISSIKLNSESEVSFDSVASQIKELSSHYYVVNLNNAETKKALALAKEDFYDYGHLQHSGALKVTKFLASTLEDIASEPNKTGKRARRLVFNENLTVKNLNLLLDNSNQKTLQLYLEKIPFVYKEHNTVVNVFPKKGLESNLSERSREKGWKSDNFYLKLVDYVNVQGGFVGTIPLYTKFKKEEIEKIELCFFKPGGIFSGRKIIYSAAEGEN